MANVANIPQDLYRLDTKRFAERQLVKPDTVRKSLCLTGAFRGVKPMHLPGGRLIWPDLGAADLAKAA